MSAPIFDPIDDDDADAFDKIVSVETFSKIAKNINYMIDSMPIGSKIGILINLAGVPTPNPLLWQPCDATPITDANSPLRGFNTPDDRGQYPKGATTLGQEGDVAGSNTKNWSHAHGGVTGVFGPISDNSARASDRITVNSTHDHGISADLVADRSIEPVHILVKFYIKVR